MDPTDLPSPSDEEPGFYIAPDLLWRQDPFRVVNLTPNSFSPPISLILDPWLRKFVVQYETQMRAYVLGEDGSQLPAMPIAAYHSHDILVLLKRILYSLQGLDLNDITEVIVDAIADVMTSVREFYHLLTASPLHRRHVPAYDKTFLEIRLSLALYRPVYFWFPHEWQPWTLIDYAIAAEETTAILTVTNDNLTLQHAYNLKDPQNVCTMAFEPY